MAETLASPLAGKTVVITRAAAQSGKLLEQLTSRNARVKLLPLVSFAPPEDFAEMDAALTRLDSFDWIVFTSANAVQAVERRRLQIASDAASAPVAPRVAAVGPATAEEAEHAGFSVDYVAINHSGAGLAEELKHELAGRKVFLPRSDRANAELPAALRKRGAVVTELIAYRTLPPSEADRESVKESLKDGVDGILFFSPSAVHHFVELLGRERLEALQGRAVMVAIGPTTARALSAAGVQRIARAADTTAEAVVESLEGHLARTHKRSTAGKEHA
ncbi:MAG TPA: uroporphyrinogen-III synthase [Candidatus Acidoferrum sp.]|nr:uroporphyrinogen-III synthase [Candidatus Acidoferrum sp.]